MPIYEYICECGNKDEVLHPWDSNESQVCECGVVMQRKMPIVSFAMKPTGRGMALDTLNSNVVGGRRKEWAEQAAAAGLDPPKRTVGIGF